MTSTITSWGELNSIPMIHCEMSWDIPSLAKAKLRVNAATTISMIIDDVLTVDSTESFNMSQLTDMDCRIEPSTSGDRSWMRAINPVWALELFIFESTQPVIAGPELFTSAKTNAPVTPNAAASVGVAHPR